MYIDLNKNSLAARKYSYYDTMYVAFQRLKEVQPVITRSLITHLSVNKKFKIQKQSANCSLPFHKHT